MDVGMAHAVCAKGILVPEPGDQYNIEKEIRESTTKHDFRADTFMQAVDWILERLDNRDWGYAPSMSMLHGGAPNSRSQSFPCQVQVTSEEKSYLPIRLHASTTRFACVHERK